ncbi:hypothetical protein VTK73DRAFT_4126 [Phialemonium thermophilum]|uniref:Uncharacterized protein n=1 Tax=Phialemonium thermophilum TaxID=223376 RepID=A0ABR3VCJ2_9PEZI
MRSARPGSSPAALWIALARHVPAGASSHVAKPQQEGIHQLDKPHAQAPVAGRHPRRRERSICPSTYALCPESAGGGCCPPLYACATDSCYATTAGATSACGREGYYACGADVSGGCCPQADEGGGAQATSAGRPTAYRRQACPTPGQAARRATTCARLLSTTVVVQTATAARPVSAMQRPCPPGPSPERSPPRRHPAPASSRRRKRRSPS